LQNRLLSLDAFRGLIMAFMVLVNTPGTGAYVYPPLRHAEWHGWTPTDVVFPSFVWIVGVAITLARRPTMGKTLRRGAVLFGLGLLVYLYPHFDFSTARILGVLQRIAICYVATVAITRWTGVRGQVLWTAGLLAGYWVLMAVGGGGRFDVEGNFAHTVDRMVLGVHNYANTKTWDPEGIVSTIPAIATCLLGVLAGQVLARKEDLARRCTWLLVMGNLLLAAALVLDHWLPVNKQLWTSSFTLLMAGLDFVMLAMMVWLVDEYKVQRPFAPFVILGRNAIAVYMASELIDISLHALGWRVPLYESLFAPLASPMNSSLLYAVAYVLVNFLIAWGLHRRGWYLRA
jgi:predicted acyltransferase